jgi:threonine/homoserine/homoserine lactone efflux protein
MIAFNLSGYLLFAFVTSITPGPNNFLLLSYGKKFGLQKAGSLMLGIAVGFSVMLYITGYGVAGIVSRNAMLGIILRIISSLWLLYLAFVLCKLNADNESADLSKTGFTQGFLLQFVNPKAWIMAVSGASAFLPHLQNIHLSVFIFAFLFALVGFPCMVCWVYLGDTISKLLKSERAHRNLSYFLFGLMVLSIIMIWI